MNCNHQSFKVRETVGSKLLNQIAFLPDGVRKELRLLVKQYQILELSREPSNSNGMSITQNENPYVFKYREFGGSEVFEWIIEPERVRK